MERTTTTLRVTLGRIVITPGALEAISADAVTAAINRHERGDWGDVCPEDRQLNDQAIRGGDRLISSYTDGGGTKFWIITEADRSATTILLPEEY